MLLIAMSSSMKFVIFNGTMSLLILELDRRGLSWYFYTRVNASMRGAPVIMN